MNTFEKICSLINERFDISETVLSPETTWEEIGVDSIDLVDLISEIEDTFDISVPDEAIEDLRTIGDVATFVETLC